MKNKTEKLIALVTGVLALIMWTAVWAQAQLVPDCCMQAIQLQHELRLMTDKYNKSVIVLEETRKAGDDLVAEKDERIKALQDKANAKLTTNSGKEKKAIDALKTMRSELENEMLRSRFLGIGRRKWAKQLRDRLIVP